MTHPIVIIGGGLAGLVAARTLQNRGFEFLLLEARSRLGGRIFTADEEGAPSDDGFDLGPSWYWPQSQPAVEALMHALGLSGFPQYGAGDVLFQRMSRERPQRFQGTPQGNETMRIGGGSGALISSLQAAIPSSRIRLGCHVTNLSLSRAGVDVQYTDQAGAVHNIAAAQVLLAVPPRLLEASVQFSPTLDRHVARLWQGTPTWMAPHAKLVAIFDEAFWRADGLSGMAQSMVGPLVEIHDATTSSGTAALFGFVGVPAEHRKAMGRAELIKQAIDQLGALFGPQATQPKSVILQDWALDPLTATKDDQSSGGHPRSVAEPWVAGEWQERMALGSSETSPVDPGYLAGAIYAGEHAARQILERISANAPTLDPAGS